MPLRRVSLRSARSAVFSSSRLGSLTVVLFDGVDGLLDGFGGVVHQVLVEDGAEQEPCPYDPCLHFFW